ncbi:aldehyde dehydrogenase family protein [Paenarthrobacter aurescens]|uniref:aldehyde dehydrogenase family protein n=1 Tax=Paenarthrobacter aurescens TaxID=43663 RepID=UPI0021C1F15D|nr:aldehyde dehydrogenase family protein [Paenarthrobacter aurescens]MCT9870413.1 aldehyde dehydrogenase family protein [Paenarthrobacter aurescens]
MFVSTEFVPPQVLDSFLARAHRMLIADQWVDAASGAEIDVVDPSTGGFIAKVPAGDELDVDLAVSAARIALEGRWGSVLPHQRAQLMHRLADLIEERGEEIAALEALEQGKLLDVARTVEVGMAADYIRYMAGWATKIEGSTFDLSPTDDDGTRFHAFTRREPVGVVAAIVPWNFPHLMAVWKVAPALATGCTVVLKPAEQTPLTALLLAELVLEAGFPPGVLNVVTGLGHQAGAALSKHPGIDKIAFTGSTSVGKLIGIEAMKNMTRTSLELGGKSPVVVLDDIDPEFIGAGMLRALFFNSGQQCVAGSRLYLPRRRYDEYLTRITSLADSLRIGSPFDSNVHLGPLISAEQRDRVCSYIESGRAEGAEVILGGNAIDGPGYFVEPTILANTDHSMRVVQEEIFGPVLVAMPYDDIEQLVEMANDSEYALAASIWSQNISRVHELVPRLKAGTIWVNTHGVLDANMPFGGFKQSGLGREHGKAAIEHYTETKSVCIAY